MERRASLVEQTDISDEEFVRQLYVSILKRGPDDSGLDYFATLLASGQLDAEAIRAALEASPEARELATRYKDAFGGEDEVAGRLAAPDFPGTRLERGPRAIELEVSSRCNIGPACVMCDIDHSVETGDISLEVVRKLRPFLREAAQVSLHGIGEPLMNRELFDIIAEIPCPAMAGFNTNGLLLSRRRAERLVELGIGWLNVSIDAATPETYRKIRRSDLSRLLDNIRLLLEIRGNGSFPLVFINMTLMRENVEEAPAFVRLGAELGADRVMLQLMNTTTAITEPVVSGDWEFHYRSQLLQNYPDLLRKSIEEACSVADELGIPLYYEQRYYRQRNDER